MFTPYRDISPHQDSAGTVFIYTAAGTAALTTTDKGNTVSQTVHNTRGTRAHAQRELI